MKIILSLYLIKEGYEVVCANDGEAAITKFNSEPFDIVLLDIMLPKKDGWEVCKEIRKISQTPIIMLSAKGEIFDKVLGLELGADDYIMKPFDTKELVARVKAVLRRYKAAPEPTQNPSIKCVEYPDLVVNQTNYSVIYMGNII